jgi:hypothetical protein
MPQLAEKSATASGKNSSTAGGTIYDGQRKNPQWLAEESSTFGRNSRSSGKFRAILCDNFSG